MLLKQIKYFVAIVSCNSFTDAAEECYISQSAISQQVQALETDLGVKLIHREKRKFSLTPAGEHFYRQGLILLDEAERLRQETIHIGCNGNNRIRIGYLRSYGFQELQQAIAVFTENFPDVDIEIINGNHEELYELLCLKKIDIAINDQRRAFSEDYNNFYLCTAYCYAEVCKRSSLSKFDRIYMEELKKIPCILVSSKEQRENEQEYYKNILGFGGNFLFAENLEEGRIMVAGNKGFIPIEGSSNPHNIGTSIKRIAIYKKGKHFQRDYFAFWRKDMDNPNIQNFVDILKTEFEKNI